MAIALGAATTGEAAWPDSSGTWKLLADPGPAPPAFNIPIGAYDPVRHRILVVENGVYWSTSPTIVHVLSLDPDPRWSVLETVGIPPAERFLGSLLYDPIRDRLLLFGGLAQNETWALSLSGTPAWIQIATTGMPPEIRYGTSVIFDPVGDRMIVFGGYDNTAATGHGYLGDTFALSLVTDAWSKLAPSGDVPPVREGHGAIYDPIARRMVIFGGHFETGLRNDLWALSLGDTLAWTELHAEGALPSTRSAFGTIYDPVRHRMWIHGGVRSDRGVEPDDIWSLSLMGPPAWTAIATLDTLRGKSYPVDVYDPEGDRMLVCGAAWYAQCASLPLAGSLRWTQFLPSPSPVEPGPRTEPAVVYDSRHDRLLALGGTFGSTDWYMWSFVPTDPGQWAPISASSTPYSWSHLAAYDSLTDRIVLYDGLDAWIFSANSDSAWRQVEASGPDYREGASIMLDPPRHRVLVYGGDHYEAHGGGGTSSQLWALSLGETPAWTLLGSGPTPYGSAGHATFYDPLRDRMVIMGGYWRNGNSRRYSNGPTLWASPLDSTLRWTALNSPADLLPLSPPMSQVVYDPRRDRLLVFADTSAWSRGLDDDGPWTVLRTNGPAPGVTAPVVFDPVRDQVVALFSAVAGEAPDQAWALGFGSPPTTLQRASATFDRVEIAWHSASSIEREADVERRMASTNWTPILRIRFDAGGTASFEDRDVLPGGRYAYRLGMLVGGSVWHTDSTWVDVPRRPVLRLERPHPNPGPGSFQVAFALPDAGPARLEIFDVRGRRLLQRQVGSLGPGTHVISIEPETKLPPGVYLLRLQHAGDTRTARAIVLR